MIHVASQMRTTKKPSLKLKKRVVSRKVKLTVDPTRLALAAMERIKTVLTRQGHPEKFGPPATMRDLAARANYLGVALPSSYSTAMPTQQRLGCHDPTRATCPRKSLGDGAEQRPIVVGYTGRLTCRPRTVS